MIQRRPAPDRALTRGRNQCSPLTYDLRPVAPWVVLAFCPLVVHWPELVGWLTANPLYFESGLTVGGSDGVLPGYPWIDGNAGVTIQALGRLVVKDWIRGVFPWWNPYSGVGLPLAAELQPGAFFFPFVFLLGLFNGVLYLKIAMQMIAGVVTYALLRELRLGRRAGLVGALLFQLNGTFAWFSDAPIMPIAFLPLFLFGIERSWRLSEEGQTGGWPWIAIAVAYSIVACFPETAYVDGLLALAWACVRLAESKRRPLFIRKVVGGGVLGMMLAAPAILPFVEYLGQTDLAAHSVVGHLGLQPKHFAMLLFPYIYGTIFWHGQYELWGTFVGGYCGICLILLAGIALASGGRERRLRWVLVLWIALAIAKAGNAPGVALMFNQIPLVRLTEFFRCAQPTWEMAAIVLAALALDDWHRGETPRIPGLLLVGIVIVLLSTAALIAGWDTIAALVSVRGYSPFLWTSLAGGFGTAAAIAVLFAMGRSRAPSLVLCGLIVVNATALFSVPVFSGTRNLTLDLPAVTFLQQNLRLSRFYTMGALAPNYGAFFGIASVNHNSMPVPQRWVDYIRQHLDPGADSTTFNGSYPPPLPWGESRPEALRRRLTAYSDIGVRYVVTPPDSDPFIDPAGSGSVNPHPALVYRDPVVSIYELLNVAPYFQAPGGECELKFSERLAVHARCSLPAKLVRRELYYPGWRADVNGHNVRLQARDSLFQELDLPAGESLVRFSYAPPGFGYAVFIFLLGAAGLFGRLCGIALFHRKGYRILEPE